MKIRTQFLITMALFGILLLLVGVSLLITNQRVERLNQQQEITRRIERKTREMSYLSNGYLIYQEEQQRVRWQDNFESITEDLNRLQPDRPQQKIMLQQVKSNLQRQQAVFDDIAARIQAEKAREPAIFDMELIKVSWSRLEVLNQGIVFDMSLLSQAMVQEVDELKQTNVFLILFLAGIIGAYILANYFLIYRRTLRSLARLRAGTQIIGAGNLSFTLEDNQPDEIGDLSRAFNQMTRNLREITASKADLENEINERKLVQAALANYAERLKRSNQELEQFAFIASHDLQEPMRKIRGFGDSLARRLGDQMEEESREYLQRMLNAAERMQNMIDGLLQLSRVGTRGAELVRVSLSEVADEAISDLELRIQATHSQVQVEALPEIDADPMQMRQLFQNLIGNAIKYHRAGVPPLIQVWSEIEPCGPNNSPAAILYIKDNGIGFSEEYLDRIFQPFTRLHGRSEYEGTGMGLAICKKIVERHRGSITARSELGQGSTFIISLPVTQTA